MPELTPDFTPQHHTEELRPLPSSSLHLYPGSESSATMVPPRIPDSIPTNPLYDRGIRGEALLARQEKGGEDSGDAGKPAADRLPYDESDMREAPRPTSEPHKPPLPGGGGRVPPQKPPGSEGVTAGGEEEGDGFDSEQSSEEAVIDPADRPPFDITQFEAGAQQRANELVDQTRRLAIFPHDADDHGVETRVIATGAQYTLPDGRRVELKHEIWDGDPTKNVAKVRVTQPPIETAGVDGQLRRVTISRSAIVDNITLSGQFEDEPNAQSSFEQELPPAPELEELGRAALAEIEEARLADRIRPDYRPGELVWVRTTTLVECKLPNSPNFRTERYSPNMSLDTQLAHITARRRAGELIDDPAYDIPEHNGLIALLAEIDPTQMHPELLDSDFDETWIEPQPTLRSWRPR